jgi:predicted permease
MIQVFTVIAPLFLIIFASALLQRYRNMGDHWSLVLNEFALKIGLPVLIFSSLARSATSFSASALLILTNSIFIIICFGLVYAAGKFLRLSRQMFRTLFICLAFGNVAYLGIPVLVQTHGEEILPAASLLVAVYLFWLFSVGTGYLDYSMPKGRIKAKSVLSGMVKDLLKNPLLISVILGLVVGALGIPLPSFILKSLDMVTASVTPTVLIVIGLFIGKSRIGKISEWKPVFLFSLATLVLLPAIFYAGLRLFGFYSSAFSSSILDAAMPLAITPFALADKYHLDQKFIARSIVLSTILSVITLPFWLTVV